EAALRPSLRSGRTGERRSAGTASPAGSHPVPTGRNRPSGGDSTDREAGGGGAGAPGQEFRRRLPGVPEPRAGHPRYRNGEAPFAHPTVPGVSSSSGGVRGGGRAGRAGRSDGGATPDLNLSSWRPRDPPSAP